MPPSTTIKDDTPSAAKPSDRSKRDPNDHRAIGVKGEPIEDGECDPDTIAEEQRRRSEDIAKVGVAKWVDDRDERPAEERTNRQVPGVAPPGPKEKR